MSEDRPPVVFKSCTRISTRREGDKGSFGVKTELNWELKRFALVFVSV